MACGQAGGSEGTMSQSQSEIDYASRLAHLKLHLETAQITAGIMEHGRKIKTGLRLIERDEPPTLFIIPNESR